MEMNQQCPTCTNTFSGNFCSICGQNRIDQRLNLRILLLSAFHQLTNLEKGFWYTSLRLLKSPGKILSDYLRGATVKIYNPFRFLFIWTTIVVIVNVKLGFLERAMKIVSEYPIGGKRIEFNQEIIDEMVSLMDFMPLMYLGFVPFMSLMTWALFQPFRYNFAEHFVVNTFLIAQSTIFSLVLLPFYFFMPFIVFASSALSGLIMVIYFAYSLRDWLKIRWLEATWKSILITVAGNTGFIFLVIVATIIFKLASKILFG